MFDNLNREYVERYCDRAGSRTRGGLTKSYGTAILFTVASTEDEMALIPASFLRDMDHPLGPGTTNPTHNFGLGARAPTLLAARYQLGRPEARARLGLQIGPRPHG